ncbi:MAG: hypothetical protein R3C56_11750 [Pirellulaceae bacterium]
MKLAAESMPHEHTEVAGGARLVGATHPSQLASDPQAVQSPTSPFAASEGKQNARSQQGQGAIKWLSRFFGSAG